MGVFVCERGKANLAQSGCWCMSFIAVSYSKLKHQQRRKMLHARLFVVELNSLKNFDNEFFSLFGKIFSINI